MIITRVKVEPINDDEIVSMRTKRSECLLIKNLKILTNDLRPPQVVDYTVRTEEEKKITRSP
jgi:hypothetical protein